MEINELFSNLIMWNLTNDVMNSVSDIMTIDIIEVKIKNMYFATTTLALQQSYYTEIVVTILIIS